MEKELSTFFKINFTFFFNESINSACDVPCDINLEWRLDCSKPVIM